MKYQPVFSDLDMDFFLLRFEMDRPPSITLCQIEAFLPLIPIFWHRCGELLSFMTARLPYLTFDVLSCDPFKIL